MAQKQSLVSYLGSSESGHCGYCKSARRSKAKTEGARESQENICTEQQQKSDSFFEEEEEDGNSVVFGLVAHCLSLDTFQQLLDLGWSRSGSYLYKPIMNLTCCPQYTIRLDVHTFRLSRTQKRVLRAMLDFLKNDTKPKEAAVVREGESSSLRQNCKRRKKNADKNLTNNSFGITIKRSSLREKNIEESRQMKKKEIRRKRALEKLLSKGVDLEQYKRDRAALELSRRRTLQSFLTEDITGWKHRFELRLVGQPSPELDADFEEEFELYKRYQVQIHQDDEDQISQRSFKRFLASSPLTREQQDGRLEGESTDGRIRLGSYHQQYRIDGRLVAVGVIDILPHCLSAKYFFYDPDFSFLSLGTYSALREIAFTQQLAVERPELHYYYMGFYLFNCPKMRYKGRFRPSDLLCDSCFDWVPLAECERQLEANQGKFTTFHSEADSQTEGVGGQQQVDSITCFLQPHSPLRFDQLRPLLDAEGKTELLDETERKVREYARSAGPAAIEMILVL